MSLLSDLTLAFSLILGENGPVFLIQVCRSIILGDYGPVFRNYV